MKKNWCFCLLFKYVLISILFGLIDLGWLDEWVVPKCGLKAAILHRIKSQKNTDPVSNLIHYRMHCYSMIMNWLLAFQISFNCHSVDISSLTVCLLEKWIPSDMSGGSKFGWSNTVYSKHATLLLQRTCPVTQSANCRTGTFLRHVQLPFFSSMSKTSTSSKCKL